STMFDKMLKAVNLYDAELIECNYQLISDNDTIKEAGELKSCSDINPEDYIKKLIQGKGPKAYTCNKLYRKDIIQDIYFSKYNYSEDYLFNIRALIRASNIVTISDQLYMYVQHSQSAVNKEFSVERFDTLSAGVEVLELI